MPERDIFDDLIDLVRRSQLTGGSRASMTEDIRQRFFAAGPDDGRRSKPEPPRSPAPARPSISPPNSSPGLAKGVGPTPVAPPVDPSPPVEVTTADWRALTDAVDACRRCPLSRTRTHSVFGEGDRQADLMFVGEGPGFHEDQSGRPFVGPAGQLLDKMIHAMQFSRQTVYIANLVKCRPPGNRNPDDAEVASCRPYLQRQIDLVQPKAIVLLGAVPLRYLLGKTGIGHVHGQWFDFMGVPTLPTFHPAFLLRSPIRKKEAWEDLQKVMIKLGKDPAQTR